MSGADFVHLRVHSEYSLIDGLVRIDALMNAVVQYGMPAVAVTDFCNLFAAVKVFQAAVAMGIKPILGVDLPCVLDDESSCVTPMVLLCQNAIGYRNLTCLVSKAYLEGQFQGQPRVHYAWIEQHAEGLIALSGGKEGDVGLALLADEYEVAIARALHWMRVFPQRFYLEIQRTERADELTYNTKLIRLADELGLPLVATNDVRFLVADDFAAHEARVCIRNSDILADSNRPRRYSSAQYLRSSNEMQALFADLPQALQNTVEISRRCTLKLDLGRTCLPNFPVPQGLSVENYLSKLAQTGLERRFEALKTVVADETAKQVYYERLETELTVINSMGFAGYFLIVADFIQWAKNNGVPVGPGRGSGAGSLVAYVLNITDLDPLQYDLLFERFLNPERVSMPDFDIDFCMEGRDRVIEYVTDRYGRDNVSQIITFGTMAAKGVLRDVGRVLGYPYGFVDKLAKLVPFELGITLGRALEVQEELARRYREEDDVREVVDLALSLEGIARNAGKHAGGVVISPTALTDFTAIYCEQGSRARVSQFDKDDVEAVGLVKFDFLGLRTLTIIDWAVKTINAEFVCQAREPLDISLLPMDDEATLTLIKACHTTAVFQVESRGMKELIHRLQPDCFEDLIALVALFRPGPLQSGMVDDFINRKHGRAQVLYPHPDLAPILKPTYGVILYQEQVMQIAQVLSNYTLGAADLLRRAMGKKKPEEMAKQRLIFTEGAKLRGVDVNLASSIFDLMEKFAGYGFNKSHSAAYALLAYQTAWLKAHHPAAFMAAVISADMDHTDKVVILVQECQRMGIKVLPPSIMESMHQFTAKGHDVIMYGLGAIKGVGEGAAMALIEARQALGERRGLMELCRCLDLRRVNRRVFDALIKSGCFDEWGTERAQLDSVLETAMLAGGQFHQEVGQARLFDEFDDSHTEDSHAQVKAWSMKQRLLGEKETLGFYLSGHPADRYHHEFQGLLTPCVALATCGLKKVTVCGVLQSVRRIMTKRGKSLAILSVEDGGGAMDCVVFSEVLEASPNAVVTGEVIVIDGELGRDDYNGGVKLTASMLSTIVEWRTHRAKALRLSLSLHDEVHLAQLSAILTHFPGDTEVHLDYRATTAQGVVKLDKHWCVQLLDELIDELIGLLGDERVRVIF